MTAENATDSRLAIFVNDQPISVADGLTIGQLLLELELPRRGIAVELNREIVPNVELAERRLKAGDRLEIVALVGGG
jgi:thiamine biosynthesis protein ThiS